MWTAFALASERLGLTAEGWRVVESQSQFSTMKIVDSVAEQQVLERAIEQSKPPVPPSCAGLHYLLATPFRYAPYPFGSRFRRARQREGCFYCSERVETAIAEAAFYHVLFFTASPGTTLPRNPQERTAFSVPIATDGAIDLTIAPLDRDRASWETPVDYAACQAMADQARAAGVRVIRYASVRDAKHGRNLALLSPAAFGSPAPTAQQTWRMLLRRDRIEAVREMPRTALSFGYVVVGNGWSHSTRSYRLRGGVSFHRRLC